MRRRISFPLQAEQAGDIEVFVTFSHTYLRIHLAGEVPAQR
jgi:hypothetical protein